MENSNSVDLMTLSWCVPEIRESLQRVAAALDEQLAAPKGGTEAIKRARLHLHQTHGALQVAGVAGVAVLTQEAELVLEAFESGELALDEQAVGTVKWVMRAIIEYLEDLRQNGIMVPVLVLFPYYRDLVALRKVTAPDPTALFEVDLDRALPASVRNNVSRSPDRDERARSACRGFERALPALIRGENAATAIEALHEAMSRLVRTQPHEDARLFYWLSLALLDGMKEGALPVDLGSRRAVGRINIMNRHLFSQHAQVPSQFIKELLLLLAKAGPGSAMVEEVRRHFHLKTTVPAEYERPRYGLADPETLKVAREALAQVRRSWEKIASGTRQEEAVFAETMTVLNQALGTTHYKGLTMLGKTLATMPAAYADQTPEQAELLAIEVATAVLFMEEALSGALRSDPSCDERSEELAERINLLLSHPERFDPTPLSWLVTLSIRATDRMTQAAFVSELKHNLTSCEQALDDYFRDSTAVSRLEGIEPLLAETTAVLRVLEYREAVAACDAIQRQVSDLLEARTDLTEQSSARLADGLSALGFFVESLLQPGNRARRFRFDVELGMLFEDESVPLEMPEQDEGAGQVSMATGQHATDVQPAADVSAAHESAARQPAEGQEQSAADAEAAAMQPVTESAASTEVEPEDEPLSPDEAELHEIFMMEAEEVLGAIDENLRIVRKAPEDREAMTTIRRAFHTLKGSSRMVGLDAFGEAAWSFEQMLNHWLAEDADGTTALFELIADGATFFGQWREQMQSRPRAVLDASALMARCAAFPNEPAAGVAAAVASVAAPVQAAGAGVAVAIGVGTAAATSAAETGAGAASERFDVHRPSTPEDADHQDPAVRHEDSTPAEHVEQVTADDFMAVSGMDGMVLEDGGADEWATLTMSDVHGLGSGGFGNTGLGVGGFGNDGYGAGDNEIFDKNEFAVKKSDDESPEEDRFDADALSLDGLRPDVAQENVLLERPSSGDAGGLRLDAGWTDLVEGSEAEELPVDSPAAESLAELDRLTLNLVQSAGMDAMLSADEAGEEAETDGAGTGDALSAKYETAPVDGSLAAGDFGSDDTFPSSGAIDGDEFDERGPGGGSDASLMAVDEMNDRSIDDAFVLSDADDQSDEDIPLLDISMSVPTPEEAVSASAQPAGTLVQDLLGDGSTSAAGEGIQSVGAADQAAEPMPTIQASVPRDGVPAEFAEPQDAAVPALLMPEPQPVAEADGQVRIGDRLVDAELFEIFNAEAVQVRTRLNDDWHAWHSSEALRAPESLVRALHTLVGTTRHVGLIQVRSIAESLEKLLIKQRETACQLPDGVKASMQAALGVVDRMLAEFASRTEPEADPATATRMASLLADWDTQIAGEGDKADSKAATPAEVRGEALLKKAAEVLGAARRETEEKKDPLAGLVDEIDADLGPVFFEEAEELMPQVDNHLREWRERPGDGAMPAALMRLFHTIKGSARMAGAMRFGQMIHELETQVEDALAQPPVQESVIEAVLAGYDQAVSAYEMMLHPELACQQETTPSEASPAPTPAPMPQAVTAPAAQQMPTEPVAVQASESSTASAPCPNQPATTPAPMAEAMVAGATTTPAAGAQHVIRVRADLLDRMVAEAGEVAIARARLDSEMSLIRQAINELTENVNRLRQQLREIEIQADNQIQAKIAHSNETDTDFDPLEFDRYTRFQEVTRMLAESVNDVSTVQQNALRAVDAAMQDLARQGQVSRSLQQSLMRVRMVQFSTINDRLYRVVRQAGKDTDKRVMLEIKGGQAEIDRNVLDRMAGPIEHILRNSVAHGIEERDVRSKTGKPDTGEVTIEVSQDGNEVIMRFLDDGQGLDYPKIEARARERGLIAPDHVPSQRELAQLIFAPGFSTAKQVTALAGRGVGMDVVRAEVAGLGGRIDLDSTPGKGSCVTVHLPVSLAVTQVVLLEIEGGKFAVQSALVEQILQMRPEALTEAYRTQRVDIGGEKVPFYFLGSLLEMSGSRPAAQRIAPVVLLRAGATRIALHVDTVVPNQEVVIKHIGPQLARLAGVAGATVLGNGDIVLILNPVQLAMARVAGQAGKVNATTFSASELQTAATVMVVDDSVTVRKVTQRLLVREGYNVLLAKDGVDALRQLQDGVPDVMLVDIEMPRMDGFDLTKNIRASAEYQHIPIIMITSRTADKHRNHALSLGVDVFLGKPYSEDELLRQVKSFAAQRAGSVMAS
ncbi:MAG: Hpt domain-containing protein [Lautropia sp.]|nr:Hpt domain-containing protein [Lautropia sp.]